MARIRHAKPAVEPERVAPAGKDDARRVFAAIAERSKNFRPAREELRRVRAVPTIFPHVDYKTHVGGWPTDRVCVVHGPSAHGKSKYVLGLIRSFLMRGNAARYVDAEMTTPPDFAATHIGHDLIDSPAFLTMRPRSYEQVVDEVRRDATDIWKSREKGDLPPETTCLYVVDSLRKLWPQDLQERIRKAGAESKDGSVDGMSGAAGRMRASLNSAWLDELVPLMYHAGSCIVFIGREADDPNADAMARRYKRDWRLTGGRGLEFDSSMVVRVERDEWVKQGPKDDPTIVGERHRVVIRKTKVAQLEDREEVGYFTTTNGVARPEGFDRGRDILLLAEELGVVKRSGAWLQFERRRWNGDAKFADAEDEVLDEVEAACRAKFSEDAARRAEVLST